MPVELGRQYYQVMNAAIDQIAALPPSPAKVALVRSALLGTFDEFVDTRFYPGTITYHLPALIESAFDLEIMNYELFRVMVLREPNILHLLADKSFNRFTRYYGFYEAGTQLITPERLTILYGYADQLAWEIAQDLNETNTYFLSHIHHLHGGRYLLLVGKYMQAHQIERLSAQSVRGSIPNTLIHLLQVRDIEESQEFLMLLGDLTTKILTAMLPVTSHGRILIARALGWQNAIPLIQEIVRIGSESYHNGYSLHMDVPNSEDPTCGVIKVDALQRAFAQAGDTLAQQVITTFQEAKAYSNTLILVEAVKGWNCQTIEKKVANHSQIHIKAYGLLPLQNGEAEIVQRYVILKQAEKAANKFGAQRRVSHAAAIQVGLANLAQIAGYSDVTRFEWLMESRLAEADSQASWQTGAYTLQVVVEALEATLQVHKQGKPLKTIPKEVRAEPVYQEAKEAVARLRSQVTRLRNGLLEGLISSGEALSPADLAHLSKLPAARSMLEKMVFMTPDGLLGMLDTAAFALRDLEQISHPITTPIILAHPYHFYQTHQLAAWQREIVHQRIVQPIKQVFRELYLLTPAEQQTNTYSNRFAGHVLDARIAAKLLGSRNWRVDRRAYDGVLPYKVLGNLRAVFSIPDAYHFLGGEIPVTSDQIYFTRYPGSYEERISLVDVPPLVFSEVMRDADLIVSVAQRAGEAHLSNEMYAQRGNIVKALLDDLGLPGVRVEGHFAHVEGKLANYRVHLGSAVIHIEPGNYLCIVPAKWGQKHEKLFLPFADAADSKTSEVISKILLLLTDDQITDESILRQIRYKSA